MKAHLIDTHLLVQKKTHGFSVATIRCFIRKYNELKSQQRPTRQVFVYEIQVNLIHTVLKYGSYYDFMDR